MPGPARPFDAVLFDLDGVLVDSEPNWDRVRTDWAAAHGRVWTGDDQRAVMGANSRGWAEIVRRRLGLDVPPGQIEDEVVRGVVGQFRAGLVRVVPGAPEAVRRIAARYPAAIASSSHRDAIEAALDLLGLRDVLGAVVSSDEVEAGKPAPDVYLLAARRLGADPARCLVVEDSVNGVLAGRAAGAHVVLVPSPSLPPAPEAFAAAGTVLGSLAELDPDAIAP